MLSIVTAGLTGNLILPSEQMDDNLLYGRDAGRFYCFYLLYRLLFALVSPVWDISCGSGVGQTDLCGGFAGVDNLIRKWSWGQWI